MREPDHIGEAIDRAKQEELPKQVALLTDHVGTLLERSVKDLLDLCELEIRVRALEAWKRTNSGPVGAIAFGCQESSDPAATVYYGPAYGEVCLEPNEGEQAGPGGPVAAAREVDTEAPPKEPPTA